MTDETSGYGGASEAPPQTERPPLNLYVWGPKRVADRPLLIFHHIPKTAGTSVRRAVELSCKAAYGTALFLPEPAAEADGRGVVAQRYRDLYARFTGTERADLLAVAGHSANHLAPLVERPHRVLTLLREPVDRVYSHFFFVGRARGLAIEDFFAAVIAGTFGGPFTPDPAQFFNGQARSLLAPYFDTGDLPYSAGPGPDAELWRARLRDVLAENHLIGVRERFRQSIELFAQAFDWRRVELPELRVNDARPRHVDLPPETQKLIRSYNWLDAELHAQYLESFPPEPPRPVAPALKRTRREPPQPKEPKVPKPPKKLRVDELTAELEGPPAVPGADPASRARRAEQVRALWLKDPRDPAELVETEDERQTRRGE
ncbi:MAG: hypothetical protein H0U42_09035 [Thermoleophilaceae bacterium]|nr:hypothetical protein [Thermoleophilaceae bacterium]